MRGAAAAARVRSTLTRVWFVRVRANAPRPLVVDGHTLALVEAMAAAVVSLAALPARPAAARMSRCVLAPALRSHFSRLTPLPGVRRLRLRARLRRRPPPHRCGAPQRREASYPRLHREARQPPHTSARTLRSAKAAKAAALRVRAPRQTKARTRRPPPRRADPNVRAPRPVTRLTSPQTHASLAEFVQLASAADEISEVATTCFIITLVVRRPCDQALTALTRPRAQGLAIGFVLLRVEASQE